MPLLCKDLTIGKQETVEAARACFKCPILVDFTRAECEHTEQVACSLKSQLLEGSAVLGQCQVEVSDYVHPVCNHRFAKPKCYKKQEYEKKAPVCVKVDAEVFKRPCGCSVPNMRCFERIEEIRQPSVCMRSVEVARPRCGHQLSLRCFAARKLLVDWSGQVGLSAVDGKQ